MSTLYSNPSIAIIQGGSYKDERGSLIYFNELDMKPIKRFYRINHPDTSIIRAWQGHRYEQKWFYVLKGSFLIALVVPDDWETPSDKAPVKLFTLSGAEPQILHVPGGLVNGFKAMEDDSALMVFSDFTIAESENDHFRFDKNKWFDWDHLDIKK